MRRAGEPKRAGGCLKDNREHDSDQVYASQYRKQIADFIDQTQKQKGTYSF